MLVYFKFYIRKVNSSAGAIVAGLMTYFFMTLLLAGTEFTVLSTHSSQENSRGEKYQFLQLDILHQSESSWGSNWDLHVDVQPIYFQGEEERGLSLRVGELFLDYKALDKLNVSVGARTQKWSLSDKAWNLGLWQPLYRHDYLSPSQQGLLGVHLGHEDNSGVFVQGFVSGLYVPHLDPEFSVKFGEFNSYNPWFRLPPTLAEENGSVVPIRYEVLDQKISDVVLQNSASFQLGWENKHHRLALSYANKPDPQLHRSILASEEVDEGIISVLIDVDVNRHQLFGADYSGQFGNHGVWASFLRDRPDQNFFYEQNWHEWNLDSHQYLSVGYTYQNKNLQNLVFSLSYLNREEEKVRKKTLLQYPEVEEVLARSYFERGNNVLLNTSLSWAFYSNWTLSWDGKYEYSFDESGFYFTSGLGLQRRNIKILLEGGVVGSDLDSNSFFSNYKGNDYIRFGGTYVF